MKVSKFDHNAGNLHYDLWIMYCTIIFNIYSTLTNIKFNDKKDVIYDRP